MKQIKRIEWSVKELKNKKRTWSLKDLNSNPACIIWEKMETN